MADIQLTVDAELLKGLFEKSDGVAKLLEQVLNEVLEAQVTEALGAQRHERTSDRRGYRNGYRLRGLYTRVGGLTLRVPQVRDGEFSTELFGRYQRSEQALVLTMMEAVINGVSTRKMTRITEELCGTSFSKSTVSALCQRLDPLVEAWRNRPLGCFPFVLVDALVIHVRYENRVVTYSVLIAIGVNAEGYRELIGFQIGDSESEATWSKLFANLKDRGLHGVTLIVSDDHGGLVKAAHRHFQGVAWQRCQTHFIRNILDHTPSALKAELKLRVREIFEAKTPESARRLLNAVVDDYADRAPNAIACLEAGFDNATAVLALPEPYRKRLRTTNGVERLNEEIRRRERVIRIFPNEPSAVRLIGALLMEQHEVWSTGKRYFDMQPYWDWKEAQNPTGDANRLAVIEPN